MDRHLPEQFAYEFTEIDPFFSDKIKCQFTPVPVTDIRIKGGRVFHASKLTIDTRRLQLPLEVSLP